VLGGALHALFHSSATLSMHYCTEEFPKVVKTSWGSRRELERDARELRDRMEDWEEEDGMIGGGLHLRQGQHP